MSLPVVYVSHESSKPLQRGHPWVYRNRLSREPSLPSGTWVQVQCGKYRAYGLWDARGSIAVRIFSRKRVPDKAWTAECVRCAWEMREPLRRPGTNAYRWLYGEGDGIPGVVVDLYGDYAVIETYAEGLDVVADWVADGLRACAELKGILLRRDEIRQLWGRKPPRDLIVEESGLRMYVDLIAGQKTGLYLDHRENRRYLEGVCAGKHVLNCFAYTGAFSLYAIRGGATEVVAADIAPQMAEEARRNLALNGYPPDTYPYVVADCFDLLEEYATRGQQFDMIILDPPSLARSKKSQYTAIRAYVRLNRAAMRCLPAGGTLATASCTSQVSPQAFRQVLGDAAARAGRRLLILHEAGHALDHPVPAHFPEGRYLKFILGRVEEIV